jgi:hypothetical protein
MILVDFFLTPQLDSAAGLVRNHIELLRSIVSVSEFTQSVRQSFCVRIDINNPDIDRITAFCSVACAYVEESQRYAPYFLLF